VHDLGQEGDDDRSNQWSIEKPWSAQHNHQRKIQTGESAIEIRSNMVEVICLQNTGHAGECAANHQHSDLVKPGLYAYRSR
jgi:hypothetical protein